MLQWFVCLFRGHDWYTWHDNERHRNRTACNRCGGEKTALRDIDINPSLFLETRSPDNSSSQSKMLTHSELLLTRFRAVKSESTADPSLVLPPAG